MSPEGISYSQQEPSMAEQSSLMSAIWKKNRVLVTAEDSPVHVKVAARNEGTDQLVGLAEVGIWEERTGKFSFQVHPEFQGKGIGSHLIQIMVSVCRERGITALEAQALPGSVSEQVLSKNGFEKVEPSEEIKEILGSSARTLLHYTIPEATV